MKWLNWRRVSPKPISSLKYQLKRYGLQWDDFLIAWRQLRRERTSGTVDGSSQDIRLEATARKAVVDQAISNDIWALKALISDAGSLLDVSFQERPFENKIDSAKRLLTFVFSLILFAFVCYMLLGGLATSETLLLGDDHIMAFFILSLLLLTLAAFEGLQIGITTLRLKDLQPLVRRYPRAAKLHQKFKDIVGTNRFLAGRQLVVIFVVYLAARLTSFPDMDSWPFLGQRFPDWMTPWFQDVFLEPGILGAFFVLWVGQLLPQLVATKNPAEVVNIPGMRWVLELSFVAESLGLTRPASWLAAPFREGEDILTSPGERYKVEVESSFGYGVIDIKKTWRIRKNNATLEYGNAILITRDGFQRIVDQSLVVKAGSVSSNFEHELMPQGTSASARDLLIENQEEEVLADGWERIAQPSTPRVGAFKQGEVLLTRATIEFNECHADRIIVTRPTRLILFRARFEDDPRVDNVWVDVLRWDEYVQQATPARHMLELQEDDEGVPTVSFCELYPEAGTSYIFSWEVEY